MKIALLGNHANGRCGVSDYTDRLLQSIQNEQNPDIEIETPFPLSLRQARQYDLIHLQYPALIYRRSLYPQILTLIHPAKVVVTLHEFRRACLLRRWSIHGFRRADGVIFTAEDERIETQRQIRLPGRTTLIPIGSNIPKVPSDLQNRDSHKVLYFGLIRPNKGLEEFLRLAELFQSDPVWKFLVIGSVPAGQENYLQEQRGRAGSNVDWQIGASPETVSTLLSSARFAYLHYPDGASTRRGSLLAALDHGLQVLTSTPQVQEPLISRITTLTDTPEEAFRVLQQTNDQDLIRNDADLQTFMSQRQWSAIARKHLDFYREIMTLPRVEL